MAAGFCRDLTKPMGAINQRRLVQFQDRYAELKVRDCQALCCPAFHIAVLCAEICSCCRVCRMLLSTRWMENQLRSLSLSPSHPSCMVSLASRPPGLNC